MSSPLLPQESLMGIDLPCNKRKYIRTRILVSIDEELERYFGTAASFHSISSICFGFFFFLHVVLQAPLPHLSFGTQNLMSNLIPKKRTFTRQLVHVGLNFVYLNLSPTHVAFPQIVNKWIKKCQQKVKRVHLHASYFRVHGYGPQNLIHSQ